MVESGDRSSPFARIVRILLILLLLGGSLWFALRDIEWDALWQSIGDADPFWIAGVALVVMAAHLARAIRWRLLIRDGKSITLFNSFSATIVGYFMNYLVPRLGELGRPYTLARREERSVSELVATVVIERVLDTLTLLLILAGMFVIAREELTTLLQKVDASYTPTDLLVKLALPFGALVLLLILTLATRLGDWLVGLLQRILPERFGWKIRNIFEEFRSGARFSGGISGLMGVIFWTIVIWLGYGLSLHCGVIAFGFDSKYGLNVEDSIVILGITAIGMAIAPTPGGFGIFHSFCRATLVTLYGIPPAEAVAFAILTHFAQYAAVMIPGIFFALREGVSFTPPSGPSPPSPSDSFDQKLDKTHR